MTGTGGEPDSYIALDDIFVKEGGCSEPGEGSLSLACSCFPSFRKKKECYGYSGRRPHLEAHQARAWSPFYLEKLLGGAWSKVTMGSFWPSLL